MNEVPIIAIVDDDASVRRSLLRVVQSAGYLGETFASAREFLAWLPHGQAACLILDVHMDDLSGLDLHDRINPPDGNQRLLQRCRHGCLFGEENSRVERNPRCSWLLGHPSIGWPRLKIRLDRW